MSGRIAASISSLVLLAPMIALSQTALAELVFTEPQPIQNLAQSSTQAQSPTPEPPQTPLPGASGATVIDPNQPILRQSPRIMGVLPNFTAVDSNTQLPRLTTREKFVVAMHDSVDYSSFLLVAALAGKGLYSNAMPPLAPVPPATAVTIGANLPTRLPAPSSPRLFTQRLLMRIHAITPWARMGGSSEPLTPSRGPSSQKMTAAQMSSICRR